MIDENLPSNINTLGGATDFGNQLMYMRGKTDVYLDYLRQEPNGTRAVDYRAELEKYKALILVLQPQLDALSNNYVPK